MRGAGRASWRLIAQLARTFEAGLHPHHGGPHEHPSQAAPHLDRGDRRDRRGDTGAGRLWRRIVRRRVLRSDRRRLGRIWQHGQLRRLVRRAGELEPRRILVDGQGRTLYLFEADRGSTSACNGACASVWPPLKTSGKPKAGSGVSASKLGTARRADGSTGVTYNGHPLYTYAGDSGPGQTSGEGIDGFGAEWYVLSATGNKVEAR